MIRVVNFLCFALSAFACLALYHVSEQTRVTHAELKLIRKEVAQERQLADVLQAEWGRVTDPEKIVEASEREQAKDNPAVELASVTQLPRRGDSVVDAEVRAASAVVAQPGN